MLRHAIACPALPTCGQAITESERIMPEVVAEIQRELDAVGLPEQVIHLRTSGCPNGCSRPYTAEIGIVGASVDMYSIYLGASPLGTRLGYSVCPKRQAARNSPSTPARSGVLPRQCGNPMNNSATSVIELASKRYVTFRFALPRRFQPTRHGLKERDSLIRCVDEFVIPVHQAGGLL